MISFDNCNDNAKTDKINKTADLPAPPSVTVEELQKEVRALKRKLSLAESNLARAKLVSTTQNRIETIVNSSFRKERQFFKLVLANTTNILLIFDFDGRFAYASNAFLEEVGIATFGFINGMHFEEILRPRLTERSFANFSDAVERAFTTNTTISIEEQFDFNLKGKPRTFSVFITPLTNEDDGQNMGIMALFNDITQINDAMETAKRANLAKSDFLANTSHEIRTPLNAVIGMSAIAQNSTDIEKIRYCLAKINDSSRHLLGVINDILDMSKIEANHFELSFSEFVLEEMLLRVVDVMRYKIEEKNIAFSVHCDMNIPYSIFSDEQRLAQIVMNLLSNAVKFTPEDGNISLRAEVEDFEANSNRCTLRISVQDSGIGISDEQKPRLFKPFSQADGSISRKFGGTGLGLAISKSIVNLLGGDIWFESTVNVGTTFTFNIKTQSRKAIPDMNANCVNIRILAVSDNPDVLFNFETCAKRMRVDCSLSDNIEGALDILRTEFYNVIFADNRTGNADVFTFVKKVRELDSGQIPMIVIIIGTGDWSKIEQTAKNTGVKNFISKPILLPAVRDILNKYCESLDSGSEKDKASSNDFSGKTILLVDDIDINREIIIALLEDTGIEIVCAENGREATNKYMEAPELYDLVFMDVQMPEMDGYEAARYIRESNTITAAQVPIVAMTANVFKEDIERCIESGMNDHIGKPVNIEEVIEKIKLWIK